MKRTLKISIILIVVALVFSLLDRGYNESIRVPLFCLFALTAFLSFLFAVIFLCRRKWRSKAKISSLITLASVMCSIIIMRVYIPYDPYDTAEKEVANYINNYNENNENSLELIKLYEVSIPLYDYVAECTMTIAGSTEKKEVFLYCDVFDNAVFANNNDCCKIETQGLNNYGFSENEIKIMELGNFYNEYALLDGDLNYFRTDEEGQRIYNDYCEGLRNLVAKEIQDQLVIDNKWYENEYGNDVIDFRIQSPNCSIENPYVKLIFCDSDGKVIQQMTKSISATFDNKGTAVSLNLGKCKTEACRFEFSVLANEVFSKEWLENYLLNEYTWKGYEDAGRFCYGAYGKANVKGINVLANKDDEIEFGEREFLQFYFIKYFDLENSSK